MAAKTAKRKGVKKLSKKVLKKVVSPRTPKSTKKKTGKVTAKVKAVKKAKSAVKAKGKGKRTPITVEHAHANPEAKIREATGSRFNADTNRQKAYELILKLASAGKDMDAIMSAVKKHKGINRGHITVALASHPDHFQVYSDGTIKVLRAAKKG